MGACFLHATNFAYALKRQTLYKCAILGGKIFKTKNKVIIVSDETTLQQIEKIIKQNDYKAADTLVLDLQKTVSPLLDNVGPETEKYILPLTTLSAFLATNDRFLVSASHAVILANACAMPFSQQERDTAQKWTDLASRIGATNPRLANRMTCVAPCLS